VTHYNWFSPFVCLVLCFVFVCLFVSFVQVITQRIMKPTTWTPPIGGGRKWRWSDRKVVVAVAVVSEEFQLSDEQQ